MMVKPLETIDRGRAESLMPLSICRRLVSSSLMGQISRIMMRRRRSVVITGRWCRCRQTIASGVTLNHAGLKVADARGLVEIDVEDKSNQTETAGVGDGHRRHQVRGRRLRFGAAVGQQEDVRSDMSGGAIPSIARTLLVSGQVTAAWTEIRGGWRRR